MHNEQSKDEAQAYDELRSADETYENPPPTSERSPLLIPVLLVM